MKLYNPSLKDFSYSYLDDNNRETIYMLRAMEITDLEEPVARHMMKHLIDFLINENGIKLNRDDDRIMWENKIKI